jgi:hypothetical protein
MKVCGLSRGRREQGVYPPFSNTTSLSPVLTCHRLIPASYTVINRNLSPGGLLGIFNGVDEGFFCAFAIERERKERKRSESRRQD